MARIEMDCQVFQVLPVSFGEMACKVIIVRSSRKKALNILFLVL